MTDGTPPRMPPGEGAGNRRHVYGPRAVGALVGALTRPALRRRSPAAAQVMLDWAAILGPALSAVTAPRSLSGGTLTIACSGPIALELQHLSGQLIGRINAAVGARTVERLRFVRAGDLSPPRPAPPPPSPEIEREALARTAGLPEGALRDALSALGRAVLARRPPTDR